MRYFSLRNKCKGEVHEDVWRKSLWRPSFKVTTKSKCDQGHLPPPALHSSFHPLIHVGDFHHYVDVDEDESGLLCLLMNFLRCHLYGPLSFLFRQKLIF